MKYLRVIVSPDTTEPRPFWRGNPLANARGSDTSGVKMTKVVLVMALILLTGCGFHLRGMFEMPQWLNNISIVIQNADRELDPLLNAQFKAYHIKTCPDPSLADLWLIIEQDGFQQQVGSISSSTTPRQYQLIYTVQFKLQRAKGKEVMPINQVIVTRQITINSNRILGSTNEEEQTKTEMRRDAAMQIIDRLSHIHEH